MQPIWLSQTHDYDAAVLVRRKPEDEGNVAGDVGAEVREQRARIAASRRRRRLGEVGIADAALVVEFRSNTVPLRISVQHLEIAANDQDAQDATTRAVSRPAPAAASCRLHGKSDP